MKYHQPVLLNKVIAGLKVRVGGRYIDATVGDGGHTMEILKKGGIVLGLDRDEEAIETAGKRLGNYLKEGKLMLVKGNFDQIGSLTSRYQDAKAGSHDSAPFGRSARDDGGVRFDGILFDLGLRSGQLESEGRGFSFQRDEPLDMRMDKDLAVTAGDLVNGLGERELFELFVKLGQVNRARAVAEAIVLVRWDKTIETTGELAGLVEKVLPRRGKLHPATKVFMALRMAVNDELGSLERALPQACELLVPGGRMAVISFHEGEDRIVKRFFRSGVHQVGVLSGSTPLRRPRPHVDRLRAPQSNVAGTFDVPLERGPFARHPSSLIEINKKPIRPGKEEIMTNPRARSARLRIGVRSKE